MFSEGGQEQFSGECAAGSLVLWIRLLSDLLAGSFLLVSRAELLLPASNALPCPPRLNTSASLWDSALMWVYIGLLKVNFLIFVLDIFFLNFFLFMFFSPLGCKFCETDDPGCAVQCHVPSVQPIVNTQYLLIEGMQVWIIEWDIPE